MVPVVVAGLVTVMGSTAIGSPLQATVSECAPGVVEAGMVMVTLKVPSLPVVPLPTSVVPSRVTVTAAPGPDAHVPVTVSVAPGAGFGLVTVALSTYWPKAGAARKATSAPAMMSIRRII